MNYFVIRDSQQFGPYSLADLQRYVAAGNVALTDKARSEAMQDAVSVEEIIGNIPAQQLPASQQSYGQVPGYLPPEDAAATSSALPPGLHWGLVLLFSVITFGVFSWIWMFVQASFVRKIHPTSKAVMWYVISLVVLFGGSSLIGILAATAGDEAKGLTGLVQLAFVVILMIGHYDIRSSLEEHYTRVENIHLRLSGGMTFFFNTIYFQYHLNQIRRWKQTGVLS